MNNELKKAKYRTLMGSIEKRVVGILVPRVPKFIETYHLTLFTVVWSLAVILSGFLAAKNINWLWLFSLAVLFQILTDLLDGAVGRYRNTGLVKWGFLMDHSMDFIFASASIIGYSFLLPKGFSLLFMILMAEILGFFFLSLLWFVASGDFEISLGKFGPSELRIFIIIINFIFILSKGALILPVLLISAFAGALIFLAVLYKLQAHFWELEIGNRIKDGGTPGVK